jgi:hypothetical protein
LQRPGLAEVGSNGDGGLPAWLHEREREVRLRESERESERAAQRAILFPLLDLTRAGPVPAYGRHVVACPWHQSATDQFESAISNLTRLTDNATLIPYNS